MNQSRTLSSIKWWKLPSVSTLKEHAELMAAISSGFLILIAWYAENHWASSVYVSLYVTAFLIGGFAKAKEGLEETVKEKSLNVELLMILAAIGSASIGYWTEGAILIFIFALSGALETYTMNKSHKEISSLMSLQPEEAFLITNAGYEWVPVKTLQIGDQILIKPGERVPADGRIVKGSSTLNESAITGESLPVNKSETGDVFAGTMNIDGSLVVSVTKPANETLFQKIIAMVQNAQSEKSPSQLFIERFESTYVKIVLAVVGLMLFLPHFLFGWTWMETIYRAMILLVVASPCALVASIMPATLSAISKGARQGILFKGGVHLEHLSHLKAIAFDKTGTLTRGEPEVTDFLPLESGMKHSILSVVSSIENESNHPLAQAIVSYAKKNDCSFPSVENVKDHSGMGVSGQYDNEEWKVGKADFVGKEAATSYKDNHAEVLASEGKTVIFVAKNERIVGLFALKDTVRNEAKAAISTLRAYGIYTIMLTGDNDRTAKAIAEEVGMDNYIAECMPDQKLQEIKTLKDHFSHVAMIGDGINDAPALAEADVGVAMGEGTDVALETADVVLMKNDLPKIGEAIQVSQKMNKIIKQNIIFSITVIMLLIVSNFLQVLDLPLGIIGHEGSTILVILNGLRLLK
ncbi:cadmium-translocating P-type ATPase [Halobacillus litoralis]|uniref:Cadmium-translocating P-type ATPase n=1 Tax=Halobacillus litoralis TaxID=45668 RepID=A0A845E9V9_9BACI|nr:heavy metal translocating P-type ATPase [Halobacillus litoralis]MYL50929.1 cadmium-translocating P-type ATPase [Halobacillus litoralis]